MENDGHFSGEIVGIGTDLTDVVRIRALLEKYSGAFLKKAFGDVEASYCMSLANPAESLAARFAAKEAVLKALGTGFGSLAPADVEITHDASGAPAYLINEKTRSALQARGAQSAFLSVTHDGDYAMATAILEG